ncbi:hypothetical protein [Flavobacterium sp.]|uniref:hypothetical protein n=1 Tax=Flavobacterium sp. TaxID=239 RepID=UPI00260D6324|nr:hypothetical protein [Flavobacterium sp.]
MKWVKRITIGLVALSLLALILDLGLNYWISARLPRIINGKNDFPYSITYEDLDISLLNSTILAKNIYLHPKKSIEDAPIKTGIYAQIKTVEVKKFKFWNLIFNDKIKAKSITITRPKVTLYKKSESAITNSKSINSQIVAPFSKVIFVSDIYLYGGDLKIIHTQNKKNILSVANISVKLEEIVITDDILKKKIPFSYRNYAFSCDSIYYRPNQFYHILTKQIETTEKGLSVKNFEMIPEYSRREFVKIIKKEKDIYNLKADEITIQNIKWGFDATEQFFFHTELISLHKAVANIYRSKVPPDDLSKKPLYNKLLREIPFDLKIDTLKVRNSLLEYEEEKTFEIGAGSLTFNRLNLTATNICSGFQKTKMKDLAIKINCRFMNISPMKIHWTLNVLDKTDGFNIKGSILKFPADKLTPFIKPYMNITAKGILDEVYFNFTGNDKTSKGNFGINYDDLKFTIYRENDRKKKNKFLTAIARIFTKKDTKEKVKNTAIEIERIPEKSFYNFLWRSIQEGLKKLLI